MERPQVLVIAVVVAALALFALRFWSSDPTIDPLTTPDGRSLHEEAAGRGGDLDGGADGPRAGSGSRVGGQGSWKEAKARGQVAGPGGGGRGQDGPGGGGGGPVGGGFGGGSRAGGSVGASGSARNQGGTSASGAAIGGEGSNRLAPRAQLKDALVDTLSERPSTGDFNKPPVSDDEDVALKVDKPQDIPEQAGEDSDVHEPEEGGDGLKITDRGRVEFPNAGNAGETGTISFQVKPEWSGSDQTDNALVQIRQEHQWNNRLELVKNGEFLRFIVTDDTGRETDISARISNWESNEQHDVQATWGDGRTTLYIDGQVAGQNTYPGTLRFSEGTPMFLGADWRGSAYNGANATLYDFTLKKSAQHP